MAATFFNTQAAFPTQRVFANEDSPCMYQEPMNDASRQTICQNGNLIDDRCKFFFFSFSYNIFIQFDLILLNFT